MPGKNKGAANKSQVPRENKGILTDRAMEKASQRPSPSNPGGTTIPSEPTGEKPTTTGPVNQTFDKSEQIVVDREASNKGSTRKK